VIDWYPLDSPGSICDQEQTHTSYYKLGGGGTLLAVDGIGQEIMIVQKHQALFIWR